MNLNFKNVKKFISGLMTLILIMASIMIPVRNTVSVNAQAVETTVEKENLTNADDTETAKEESRAKETMYQEISEGTEFPDSDGSAEQSMTQYSSGDELQEDRSEDSFGQETQEDRSEDDFGEDNTEDQGGWCEYSTEEMQDEKTEQSTEELQEVRFEEKKEGSEAEHMEESSEESDSIIDTEENKFLADRSWVYESYDAFAQAMTGVPLERTGNLLQFYNTYVDPAMLLSERSTIDKLFDSNADWYSDDYILWLNPTMFQETVPVYYGSDGCYYAVSAVPWLNQIEVSDYQPASDFYNDRLAAEAFHDIAYLGNGVYRIPVERYQYCFTEQYVSDGGTLYGISFGLRIQVLYGLLSAGEVVIAADVLYPDMTEQFLPAYVSLASGLVTVRVFSEEKEDTLDSYLISASINRGASLPLALSILNDGKVLQFSAGDGNAIGSLDILIGCHAERFSYPESLKGVDIPESLCFDSEQNRNLTAVMNDSCLQLSEDSIPDDLAVGDKFVYENTRLTITGVNHTKDGSGTVHVGAVTIPTHDAQEFCLYSPYDETALNQINSFFKYSLSSAQAADPGYLVQMTAENITRRAASNGTSINLRDDNGNPQKIFGYLSETLESASNADGKKLNLEGTQVLLACMHAWHLEAATPPEIVSSINSFTERTAEQEVFASDIGYGNYLPNLALQCTDIHEAEDGYTYVTFKVVTSMLGVRGVANPQNYQCAFATLNVCYKSSKRGYLKLYKSSSNPIISDGNSCYQLEGIRYGVYTDEACNDCAAILCIDKNGESDLLELAEGAYYIREISEITGSGYKCSEVVYPVSVTAGNTENQPVLCSVQDDPIYNPLGIQIKKINGDGGTSADLSGAEYTVCFYDGRYTREMLPDEAAAVWRIQTLRDSEGNYYASLRDECIIFGSAVYGRSESGEYMIPLGTITVQETKAPAGYTTEGAVVSNVKTGEVLEQTDDIYLFHLVDENGALLLRSENMLSVPVDDADAVTLVWTEQPIRAGIRLVKRDSANRLASGDASFAGIRFAIVNHTGDKIRSAAGYLIEDGEVVQVVTTDENGYAATEPDDLPVGTYLIKELRMDASFDGKQLYEGTSPLANESYYWSDKCETVTICDDDSGQLVWAGEFYNDPVTAAPILEKYDFELNKKETMGGASFEGIEFEISNESKHPVVIAGIVYETGEPVVTVSADAEGNVAVTTQFPIGRYSVREKCVNETYTMTEGETHYFQVVSSDGAASVQYEPGCGAVIFRNRVVRGDICFEKKNGQNGEVLSYVPFRITNDITGETHYILTDADGCFSSAGRNTVNTNMNDAVLSRYDENDVIEQSVIESLNPEAGIWFGLGSEGTMTAANDSYGAFVYGSYSFTELKTQATRNMRMYSGSFSIESDSIVIDLGTVINIPMSIQTTLVNQYEEHVTQACNEVTLTDHVAYRNLDTEQVYTLTGTLYVKDDEELTALLRETVSFQPTQSDGIQDVVFTFDASELAGKSVVAFEELFMDGVLCAEHKDINDKNQTVSFPLIHTRAVNAENGMNQIREDRGVQVADTVAYSGLIPGRTYMMKGMLMLSEDVILQVNGMNASASIEFVPETSDGSVDVIFDFDPSGLGGKRLTVFEYLYQDGILIAEHKDIADENQTLYVPRLQTRLSDPKTGLQLSLAENNITLIDTISYSGVQPGRCYFVRGMLVDRETGDSLIDDAGNPVTAEAELIPQEISGEVDMVFSFPGTGLAGRALVAYETLYSEDEVIAVHADPNDENQTQYIPAIHTSAKAEDTQDNITGANEIVIITDEVSLSGLKIGNEYTIEGILMDQMTGSELEVDGKTVTAAKTFLATESEMTMDLCYELNASELAGASVVVFESLYTEGVEIGSHQDIAEEGQTIHIPEIKTSAVDKVTNDRYGIVSQEACIVDTVNYRNLIPGKEYTITGILMDHETGEALERNGERITAVATFVAEAACGSVLMEYHFNSLDCAGKTVVVFEEILYNGIVIAAHADLEDEKQSIIYPSISTTAQDEQSQSEYMTLGSSVVLNDTVSYSGLKPGKVYLLRGTVMDQAAGTPIGVMAEIEFTPEASEGAVIVSFLLDTRDYEGKTLVVFETLYDTDGCMILEHCDIGDINQTVYIPAKPVIPPVVTGDNTTPMPYIFGLAAATLIAILSTALYILDKRRHLKRLETERDAVVQKL